MAVVSLRPSADGTTTSWTRIAASGTFASKIVDDPDSNDGDTSYVLTPNVTDGTMWVQLDDMPVDFNPSGVTDVTIVSQMKKVNTPQMNVDDSAMYFQLERSDESTDITAESTVCTVTVTASYTSFSRTVAVTGTHSNTDWNGARLKIRYDHTTQQTADTTNQIRLTAVEVNVTYTPAVPGAGVHHVMMGGPYF